MFVCEKDESLVVRRIEDKLGIHGSPTCELQFNNTKAYLVGKRRMGLIRYVMSLMNGARIGVSAQGLGIAQAAYFEGLEYAKAREQFGTAIVNMPLVYDMLINARVSLEAVRITNIYEGTTQLQFVAAIGGVITHAMDPELDKMEMLFTEAFQKPYRKELNEKRELLNKTVDYIKEKNDHAYQSYYSGKLVDMATKIYTAHLFLKYAPFSEDKKKTTDIYFEREMTELEKNFEVVTSGKRGAIEDHADLLQEAL